MVSRKFFIFIALFIMAIPCNAQLTINIRYTGEKGATRRYVKEMEKSGIADAIRAEAGNEKYEYFIPLKDPETVLLIDSWKDQESLDRHHASAISPVIQIYGNTHISIALLTLHSPAFFLSLLRPDG